MARNYKNLKIWKLSYDLVLDCYKLTKKMPEEENSNLILQIRRAATSIPLNIAEGSSRQSKKAFLQFISYAYGSAKELQVQFRLAHDLKYISSDEYLKISDKIETVSAKIFKFMKKVNNGKFFNWYKK